MKRDKQQAEDEALMKEGIDERLIAKPRSKLKVFAKEQDLCENERIDNRKAVFLVVQMTLRENDALMNRKQPKDHPKVEEDYNEAPELFGCSLSQLALARNWKAFICHIRSLGFVRRL